MINKKVVLNFPKTITDLTGNTLGRRVFDEQVKKEIIDENTCVIVEVPAVINDVGTSFIQGMYAFLSEKYGSSTALDIMTIFSENVETNSKIQKVIEVYGI